MSKTRRASLGLLALAYFLASVLVDLGHRHDWTTDDSVECVAACHAPGPHLSGHKSPDLTKSHHDCPACQHRNVQVVAPEPVLESRAPRLESVARRDPPRSTGRSARPSTVRGPPVLACA